MFSNPVEDLDNCVRCRCVGRIDEDARGGWGLLRAACSTLWCLRREVFYGSPAERESKLAELRAWWSWRP